MKTDFRHRGWYSRGYIPHYDGGDMYQVITYRLADSLPAAKLEEIMKDLHQKAPKNIMAERRKRIEKWLDAGYGSCLLQYPDCAHTIIKAWQHFDGIRYDLAAWVVMPNHVHVLAFFRKGWSLGKVVNTWKSYTANQIKKKIPEKVGNNGIWQRGYWDRYIRSETHFYNTIGYILHNPIEAGLVKKARDWPFSGIKKGPQGRRPQWRPPEKPVKAKPDNIKMHVK